MRKLRVIVDNREKKPIQFPELFSRDGEVYLVTTEEKSIPTGDYILDGPEPSVVGIERKGSPEELFECTLGYRHDAFEKQLTRMKETYQYPVLLIDSTPSEVINHLWHYPKWAKDPKLQIGLKVVTKLLDMAMSHGVQVMWTGRADSPARRLVAGQVVLALLTAPVPRLSKDSEEKKDSSEENNDKSTEDRTHIRENSRGVRKRRTKKLLTAPLEKPDNELTYPNSDHTEEN